MQSWQEFGRQESGWQGFATIEADVRSIVVDPRWPGLPERARAETVATRMLVTPDGGIWLYGAHARWYLLDPADGRWHLAAPPKDRSARPGRHPAAVLSHLLPRASDFTAEHGSAQAFVGPDVPHDLTEHIRVLVRANGRRSQDDFPLSAFEEVFAKDVPSTVAAIWATIMWCAHAPAFDGNERLLSVFGEYLGRPLPGDEWVRWLPAPPLTDLVTLYAERLRAGATRPATRLAALMGQTAELLSADARFRPRASALIEMVEPPCRQPDLDERAAAVGDDAVRHAWLNRVPERLSRAVLVETDPGEHLRHAVYDLVEALGFTGDPPATAAAFLAADLGEFPEAVARVSPWLDHRVRRALHGRLAVQKEAGGPDTHPDGFPVISPHPAPPATGNHPQGTSGGGEPAAGLSAEVRRELHVEPPDRASAATVLGAAYAAALAWCRLTGTELPRRGFPGAAALVHRLIHERDDEPHLNH